MLLLNLHPITRGFLCGTLDHDHQSIPSDLSNSNDSYIQTMARWKIKYEMTCNHLHVRTIALQRIFIKKHGLQSFVRVNDCSPQIEKIKYEMTCNHSHVRTIALQKFKKI
jgi:hypothetical protein